MIARMKVNTRMARYVGTLGVGALLLPGIAACAGEVMVGDVNDGTASVAAAATCAEEDAYLREPRERWLATANDFGALAGSRWEGAIDGLPTLVLELGADQTGSLVIGTPLPAPTERDEAYLTSDSSPYPVGATYRLQGGSFDGDELLLPIPHETASDDWCALQIPMFDGHEGFPCVYTSARLPDCGDTTCTLSDGRVVTWAWIDDSNKCECTSTECFAQFYWPEWEAGDTFADLENYYDLPVLRLTYDPDTDTLKGAHFPDGSPPPAGREGKQAKFVRAE
jgi:hypothetical protein